MVAEITETVYIWTNREDLIFDENYVEFDMISHFSNFLYFKIMLKFDKFLQDKLYLSDEIFNKSLRKIP